MKKFYISILSIFIFSIVHSQTWTGSINTDWDTPGNWTGGTVPNATSVVTIPSGGTGGVWPKLASNVTINSITLANGSSLDVNGYTMTINTINQFVNFFGAIISNSSPTTDIVFNITTSPGGYIAYVRRNTFNDNVTFNIGGGSDYREADLSSTANTYNGNVTWNISSGAQLTLGGGSSSTYAGNLTISRTVEGTTTLFNNGTSIAGNFVYSNNVGGVFSMGNITNLTTINGTINVNHTSNVQDFDLYGITNLTTGGSIVATNTKGLLVQNNNLEVTALSITGYGGSQYARLYDNTISGDLTLEDAASYAGGYNTTIRNSNFMGDVSYTINGTNSFFDADNAGNANTYDGNVSVTATGTATVSFSTEPINVTGNLTINRTGGGITDISGSGGTIGGNFSFTNNAGGNFSFGNNAAVTSIQGKIDIMNTQTIPSIFYIQKIKNLTPGGSITAAGTKGFNMRNDTLTVNNLSLTGYTGSAYAYAFDNKITGDVTIQDDASYTGGWNTTIRNNNFMGNVSYTINGTNSFFDADNAGSANTYDGNVSVIATSTATVSFSTEPISVTGNLTINRIGGGITDISGSGGTIGGNFSFTNNAGGNFSFGNSVAVTSIQGKIDITNTQTSPSIFYIQKIKNLTPGGSIMAAGTKGFNVRNDTLVVNSLSITDYTGSAYAYAFDNKITGDVTIEDDASYTGGWSTTIRNSNFMGDVSYTINGTNSFLDADNAGSTNIYDGNVNVVATGTATVSFSNDPINVAGNLTINRTSAGITDISGSGGTIGGNFSFTNNAGGNFSFGNNVAVTSIQGKIDITNTQASPSIFYIQKIKNLTGGGSIAATGTLAFNVRNDTLVVNSLSITGYSGSVYAYAIDNKITGDVTIEDDASYTGGWNTTINNNCFTGNTSYTVNGANAFSDATAGNTGNTYLGNVQYNRVGNGAMNVAVGDTSYFGGDFILNSNVALPITTNKLEFVSAANGTITQLGTQPFTLPNVIMSKSGNATLSLGKSLTIGNNLKLDSGRIIATATNKLIIPAGITYMGSSDKSFVEGPIDKVGNTAFVFPVGKDTALAPIAISAPSSVTDVFTANYFHNSPHDDGYDTTAIPAGIDHIGRLEYWTLDRTNGSSNVTVNLYHDQAKHSGVVIDQSELRVVRWNGSLWVNEGNGGTTGSPASGTVSTAGAISSFSPFAIASTTARNTLPLRLISFTGTENNGIAQLVWITENEVNVEKYELEKSKDGNIYSVLTSALAKNNLNKSYYNAKDYLYQAGTYFYRLKMIDVDGKLSYSNVVKITKTAGVSVAISPNPVKNKLTISGVPSEATVRIVDNNGKTILTKRVQQQGQLVIDLPLLNAGVYIVQVITRESKTNLKFIKE